MDGEKEPDTGGDRCCGSVCLTADFWRGQFCIADDAFDCSYIVCGGKEIG